MLNLILYLFYLFGFSKDPFIDFRKYKISPKKIKENNFKFLGFVKNIPVLTLKGVLIYPLENNSFNVIYLNRSCIKFYYKNKRYNICR